MKEQLAQIKQQAVEALQQAQTPAQLEDLRVRFLGKKGELTAVLKQMGKLSPEERPVMGQLANTVRAEIEEMLEKQKAAAQTAALEAKLASEALDVTIPGKSVVLGHAHPMNQVLQQIKDLFVGMGYQIVDGPEVELADYNFTKLNIEEGHPSRDPDPDQPHADSGDGKRQAPHLHPGSRPGLPEGRGRRHPLPHVPPD